MNKQEALKKIEKLDGLTIKDKDFNFDIEMIPKGEALEIVNQLDEPEKPVVPQFVADFYESIKDDFEDKAYDLFVIVEFYEDESELSPELYWWFKSDVNKPIQTLVNMHQFGYEVKKEKLYTARLKLLRSKKYSYINKDKDEKTLFISDVDDLTDVYQTHFTQAELEGLGVWDNPAFEIEEVEE